MKEATLRGGNEQFIVSATMNSPVVVAAAVGVCAAYLAALVALVVLPVFVEQSASQRKREGKQHARNYL